MRDLPFQLQPLFCLFFNFFNSIVFSASSSSNKGIFSSFWVLKLLEFFNLSFSTVYLLVFSSTEFNLIKQGNWAISVLCFRSLLCFTHSSTVFLLYLLGLGHSWFRDILLFTLISNLAVFGTLLVNSIFLERFLLSTLFFIIIAT